MVVLGNTLAAMAAADQSSSISNAYIVDEHDHYNEEWVQPFEPRSDIRIKTDEKFTDSYDLFEEIGEGKFGKVYRCVEKRTGLTLAAKCIRLKKDADLQKVEKEVNIMTRMRHKCIAQIYDAFATSTNDVTQVEGFLQSGQAKKREVFDVILIMEIVEGGELFLRVSEDHYILTEMAVAMVVIQICQAIQYIHSLSIIHLDLKPENIMVLDKETSNQIKLIDFGLAQYYDGRRDLLFMAGTPEFAAPEVIKYEPLDFHTDMWSVGVITYILLSGESPFLGENVAVTYCNVERGHWSFCEEFDHNCISDEARDFITKLLVVDKSQRMLADECLLHPWLVKCKERARSTSPYTLPLNTAKLRSYVRNRRFRRAVFGVLFINTVIRTMMRTFRERKSRDGLAYAENMMQAATAGTEQREKDLAERILYSRHCQLSPTIDETDAATADTPRESSSSSPFTSKPVGPVLKKKMRRVPKPKPTESASSTVKTAPPTSSTSEAESEQASQHTTSASIRRKIERTKRSKSATRKSSSNEQQRRPKKPKPSTPSSELADVRKESAPITQPSPSVGAVASKVATLEAGRQLNASPKPKRPQRVVFDDQPKMKPIRVAKQDDSNRPKNLVSSMLKRLEEMNAPNGANLTPTPMKMTVSDFTPAVTSIRTRQSTTATGDTTPITTGKRELRPRKKIDPSTAGVKAVTPADGIDSMHDQRSAKKAEASYEAVRAGVVEPVAVAANGVFHALGNGGEAKEHPLGEIRKKKLVKVARKKEAQSASGKPTREQCDRGAWKSGGFDSLDLGRRRRDKSTFDFSDSSSTQDAFDFSLLRMKLQNRILGHEKDEEDLARDEANRLNREERLQLNYTANINTKRAMRKWTSLDKRNADRPLMID